MIADDHLIFLRNLYEYVWVDILSITHFITPENGQRGEDIFQTMDDRAMLSDAHKEMI